MAPVHQESSPNPTDGADSSGDTILSGAAGECRLSVERVIPGDDSGASGEPLVLSLTREFIREQQRLPLSQGMAKLS